MSDYSNVNWAPEPMDDPKDAIITRLSSEAAALRADLARVTGERDAALAEVAAWRKKADAAHHYDCQYVGCIEKPHCPEWAATQEVERLKTLTDALYTPIPVLTPPAPQQEPTK